MKYQFNKNFPLLIKKKMLEENTLSQAAILATSRKTYDANWRKFSAQYWVPKIFL